MILENIFTERVVNCRNSLPSLFVEAPSLNYFKTRLDKFWSNQDIVYDFKAPFLGTGSRLYRSLYYVHRCGHRGNCLRSQCQFDTIRYDVWGLPGQNAVKLEYICKTGCNSKQNSSVLECSAQIPHLHEVCPAILTAGVL